MVQLPRSTASTHEARLRKAEQKPCPINQQDLFRTRGYGHHGNSVTLFESDLPVDIYVCVGDDQRIFTRDGFRQ